MDGLHVVEQAQCSHGMVTRAGLTLILFFYVSSFLIINEHEVGMANKKDFL